MDSLSTASQAASRRADWAWSLPLIVVVTVVLIQEVWLAGGSDRRRRRS